MSSVKARAASLAIYRRVYLMTAVLLAAAHPVSAGELHQFAGSAFQSFTLKGVTVKSGALSLDTSAAEKVTDADGPAKGRTYYRGTATSRPVAVEGGFREIVLSWNADCPQGSWIVLEARASRKSGWTEWFNMGVWAADDFVVKRTHLAKQNTPEGRVNTDTLVLKDDCSEAQVRISLCSLSSAMIPAVRRLFCDFTPAKPAADADPPSGAPEAVLNVPEISQLSYPPRGGVWCSPTSVTMVMNYWAAKMNKKEWETDVRAAAAGISDEAWGGTGNWSFNAAYAGSRPGLVAYCERMSGLGEAERWIRAGIPVILSISANVLHGRGTSGGGHLIVCVGFDSKGDAICNDPYARLDDGQKVRRVYGRESLRKAWANSRFAAYLIYPEALKLPEGMGPTQAAPEATPAARPGS